jgi:hypothetical protein
MWVLPSAKHGDADDSNIGDVSAGAGIFGKVDNRERIFGDGANRDRISGRRLWGRASQAGGADCVRWRGRAGRRRPRLAGVRRTVELQVLAIAGRGHWRGRRGTVSRRRPLLV